MKRMTALGKMNFCRKLGGVALAGFLGIPCMALDMSFGAGGFYTNTAAAIKTTGDNGKDVQLDTRAVNGGGGFLFFDIKYCEINLDFGINNGSFSSKDAFWTEIPIQDGNKAYKAGEQAYSIEKIKSTAGLGFSFFVKLPVTIGRLSIFPLAGINYNLILFARQENGAALPRNGVLVMQYLIPQGEPNGFPPPGSKREIFYGALTLASLDNAWLKAGLGFDITFNPYLYLRFECLYGLQIFNNWEYYSYQISFMDGGGKQSMNGAPQNLSVKLACGLKIQKRGRKK